MGHDTHVCREYRYRIPCQCRPNERQYPWDQRFKVCLDEAVWGVETDAKNDSGALGANQAITTTAGNQNATSTSNSPRGNSPQPQPTPIHPPSLELNRPNPAEKVQKPPQHPVPTRRQRESPGRHELTEEMATRQSPLASGSHEGREVTVSVPTASWGTEKTKLPTFETPKPSLGVPPWESLDKKRPLAPKSLTPFGATDPQVSSGPIRAPNAPPPPNNQRPEQHTTSKPTPLSQTSPPPSVSSQQNSGGGIQPPPPDPKLSNPAGRLQQSSQGPVPTGQRTEKPGLDESAGRLSTSPSVPVPGSLENREVTTSSPIAPREPSSLVRTSEKIGLQTSQTPKASLNATSVPSQGSQAPQQPLVPKSLAPPKVPHPQASSGHIKTPEEKTTSTLGSYPPVDRGSSTPLLASTTPGLPPVRPSYNSYGIA